jgi:heat shock protein HslJ
MQRRSAIGLLAFLAILLAGCRLLGGSPGAEPAPEGTWRLTSGSLDGAPIVLVAGSEPTLSLSGAEVGGRAGCNSYGGTATVEGDRIAIAALSMTEMACDEGRMAVEAAYVAALSRITSFRLVGDDLTLIGDGGELTYRRVPPVADVELVGTSWLLQTLFTGPAASSVVGEPATLSFEPDGRLSGATGCRTFGASFTRSGDTITVSSLAVDDRACSDDLAAQDARVLDVITGPFTVSVDGSQLTLSRNDGSGLGYQAELPD